MDVAQVSLGFMQWIVFLLLIIAFVGAIWLVWCCATMKARLDYLEAKLKALYEHYAIAMPPIIDCVTEKCKQGGGQDPDWPPPSVPKWP